jgi:hypothetical protein
MKYIGSIQSDNTFKGKVIVNNPLLETQWTLKPNKSTSQTKQQQTQSKLSKQQSVSQSKQNSKSKQSSKVDSPKKISIEEQDTEEEDNPEMSNKQPISNDLQPISNNIQPTINTTNDVADGSNNPHSNSETQKPPQNPSSQPTLLLASNNQQTPSKLTKQDSITSSTQDQRHIDKAQTNLNKQNSLLEKLKSPLQPTPSQSFPSSLSHEVIL